MTVDEFVKGRVVPEYRGIVKELRQLMRTHAPAAREIISYGIPAYKCRRIIAVISPTKKGITFAFSRGAEFEDKYGLLEGVGKVSKNVRMSDVKDVNKAALRYYIKQALKFDARWRLIHHARELLASDSDLGSRTIVLNVWLGMTPLVLGLPNLPLAAPAFFNIGYQRQSRRVTGWAIVGVAVILNVGLFLASLVFLASGQTFEQFSGME